jgi:hypothetical protein
VQVDHDHVFVAGPPEHIREQCTVEHEQRHAPPRKKRK